MRFKANTRRKANVYEKDLVEYWKKNKTFEKSVEQRPVDKAWVFYDGPPFLTGTPHHGHLMVSALKDTVARYWTMKGHRVERRWGWDCHGLPAEVFVEKQLGIANKKEIGTKISIADYVASCRAAMVKTGTEWEDTIERLGRWVEFKGAYKTMDNEYMESVWWAFKTLYDTGKIYEGEKILVYCTKDATPISKSEVAMENSYQNDTDPSVFVYFKLVSENRTVPETDHNSDAGVMQRRTSPRVNGSDEYLLAWTTTPWTLPANVAVAVNEHVEYSLIEHEGKKFYVAKDALDKVMTDAKHQKLPYTVIKNIQGKELVGRIYEPLFQNHGPAAHRVLAADFVTTEDGTGIVHEAPAYGEEDYELCKKENIPLVSIVDENGHYTEGRWIGQNIWDVNKEIAKTLVAEDKALKVEYIQHEYPHCHRCGTKLMYRAHPSWFLDIQGQKDDMLAANETTNWVPDNLRSGRFKYTIESAPDWNLSRDRYWATPLPIWKGVRNDGTEVVKVIGSFEEFQELTGKKLEDYHLPNVMDVVFTYDDTEMKHIGKVIDCWFESGSMPFAQFHYPFENKEVFERSFPADFITEAIDQTRGWFYALTAVNVGLFGKSPFKNLICTGHINAADGKKLSKKLKNYTDPMELMDQFSADSFRFLLMSSPLTNGESFALVDKDVNDVARKLGMVWNMYDFFTMYASVDDYEYDGSLADPSKECQNLLDIWIISRLHQLIGQVSDAMDSYKVFEAARPIFEFVDDASNWYVRRSRRRFWKSEDDADKNNAYRTLHYILAQLAKVMAPFTPFLSEELYRNLTGEESVHLVDWPEAGDVNEHILKEMEVTRYVITGALAKRAEKAVKVRQPLASLKITLPDAELNDAMVEILKDEVNVKEVIQEINHTVSVPAFSLDSHITPALHQEGLMREVIRAVQVARKAADLQVDDRIKLSLVTADSDLKKAITDFESVIAGETLAAAVDDKKKDHAYSQSVKIEGRELQLELERA